MSQATLLADQLDDFWAELEAAGPVAEGELSVMELPVDAAAGRLLLGAGGGRHLLVPLPSGAHRAFREDRRGAALHLRLRPQESGGSHMWYADLVGLKASLNHVFSPFCVDVIARIEEGRHDPVQVLRASLVSWRSLFASGERRLTLRQLAGLYAELEILVRLLQHHPDAVRLWHGPLHGLHDFSDDHTAVEVKATLSDDDRKVHIHHLDQLEPPTGGSLSMAFFRLDTGTPEGATVPELVGRALELGDENGIVTRLEAGGYYQAHIEHYARNRFLVLDEIWFDVNVAFPRLRASSFVDGGLPEWASDLEYRLDLAAAAHCVMDKAAVDERLRSLHGDG
jgi:hypothetical protein